MLAVVYPAMDGRRQITVKANGGELVDAADGFYVVAGHNPGVHGAVLSDALASRFSAQIHVSTDYDLATQLGIDRRAVRAATALATRVRRGDIGWAPQLRELIAFARIAEVLGPEAAAGNLVGIAPEDDRDTVAAVGPRRVRRRRTNPSPSAPASPPRAPAPPRAPRPARYRARRPRRSPDPPRPPRTPPPRPPGPDRPLSTACEEEPCPSTCTSSPPRPRSPPDPGPGSRHPDLGGTRRTRRPGRPLPAHAAPAVTEPVVSAAPVGSGWERLSAALTDLAPVVAGREDLTVVIAPGAGQGAPACLLPAQARIEIDGTHLAVDPDTADPAHVADRYRYPTAWGLLVHECAHGRHTRWEPDAAAAPAAVRAAMLLEESRIEAAQTRRRPDDRHWLRAAATDLILADLAPTPPARPPADPAGGERSPSARPQPDRPQYRPAHRRLCR